MPIFTWRLFWTKTICAAALAVAFSSTAAAAAEKPKEKEFTNSIGMKLVHIEPGAFMMGNDKKLPDKIIKVHEVGNKRKTMRLDQFAPSGDFDERPLHKVTISRPFYIGMTEVTNTQFERFDPRHMLLRGKNGFSVDRDEAVVFVSWHEAKAFCDWLSKKESLPYRLPTEAEWEYACRAGTTGPFWTGDVPPPGTVKNPDNIWYPEPRRGGGRRDLSLLHVGKLKPNPFGLFDMHGNVEEWCTDWYGPYVKGDQTDPTGRFNGDFKVSRGGSHSTVAFYLRSANRMATLPEDKHWLIGFRVVIGPMPGTKPLPLEPPSRVHQNVRQSVPAGVTKGPDTNKPYFREPQEFVKIPKTQFGPIFGRHNHCPAIAECPNGDLLAVWYSTMTERGREITVAGSRLRRGQKEWEPASLFWDPPDRNDSALALWYDGDKTLYHFNSLSVAATWGPLAVVMRTSTDSGATWSKGRLIVPEHHGRRQVIGFFRTRQGHFVLHCDATPSGSGGTALHISKDRGKTWHDPGGTIAGIHAGVAETTDGRLIAFGRGDEIKNKRGVERMPMSISADLGKTWEYFPSPFTGVGGGQKPVLKRLKEGPLLLCAYGNESPEPVQITDSAGKKHTINGLYAAVSYDDGRTWPHIRVVADRARKIKAMNGREGEISPIQGERKGYLAATQARDGVIHLISSRQHYAFNLKWLQTPTPAVK